MKTIERLVAATLACIAVVAVVACGSGGGSGSGSQASPEPSTGGSPPGGGGTDPCDPFNFQVGSTCTLTLAPFEQQEIIFIPGQGGSLLTISLTGSTTYADWTLGDTCDDFTFGIDQSCVTSATVGAQHHLFVYEADGRAGTTNLTISQIQNLGSIAKPVPVSTDSLVNGSVAASGASYFSFTAAQSANYTIALTGLFTQLSWDLFDDPGYLNQIQQCTFTDQAADLACLASLSAGSTYYLRVQEFSGAPQLFQVTIGSGDLNEGSLASPVALVVGASSRSSTVDVFGHSYFTFTPSASGPHAIQLDGHSIIVGGRFSYSYPSDYGWTLFSDSNYTTVVKACRDFRQIRQYPEDFEHCAASLTSGVPYYLRVDEQAGYPNRIYELAVVSRTGGGGTSEGAIGAPRALGTVLSSASGWGTVAASGSSYYSFQTGSSASSWRIGAVPYVDSFFFAGANLTWFLFDDSNFSNEIARCDRAIGIAGQNCLTPQLAASTTYYLQVRENDNIAQDLFQWFLYSGFPSPTLSSIGAPIPIPLGTSGIDVVQDNFLSDGYYSFTTAQSGTYEISAQLSTGGGFVPVAWSLFDDSGFSNQIAHCYLGHLEYGGLRTGWLGTGTNCSVKLSAASTLYLRLQTTWNGYAIGNSNLHLSITLLQ